MESRQRDCRRPQGSAVVTSDRRRGAPKTPPKDVYTVTPTTFEVWDPRGEGGTLVLRVPPKCVLTVGDGHSTPGPKFPLGTGLEPLHTPKCVFRLVRPPRSCRQGAVTPHLLKPVLPRDKGVPRSTSTLALSPVDRPVPVIRPLQVRRHPGGPSGRDDSPR